MASGDSADPPDEPASPSGAATSAESPEHSAPRTTSAKRAAAPKKSAKKAAAPKKAAKKAGAPKKAAKKAGAPKKSAKKAGAPKKSAKKAAAPKKSAKKAVASTKAAGRSAEEPAPPEPPSTDRSAAFFDLDRTLLAGASGPILGEALRHVGLLPPQRSGLEDLAFRIFDTIGETLPAMLLSRQGARVAKGWSIALVEKAAGLAAEPLAAAVLPYAHHLLDHHREEGRLLVMATTTPVDLIEPLADLLGFDAVVATRYGRDGEHYDGTIDGDFVWGREKAKAVAEWAGRHRIDLDLSYAYSDSYYDTPLLSLVGHPTVVNPDPRMWAVATLRRWPVVHLDVPAGVPKMLGVEPQRAAMALAQPQLLPFVRFDLAGLQRIPLHGAAILVANHRSYFDPLAVGYLLARRGRTVRFLGKKEVFDAPVLGDLAAALGGIRVERGSGSEEPLKAAQEALHAGEMVAIMPEGTIPRGPAFFDPVLHGRWGAARLAQATGAPVIPVGMWGTEIVWPRSSKIPNVTNVLDPPKVRIRVGHAVPLGGRDLDDDTRAIMDAIAELLPPEARRRRAPTREELAATYPDGKVPDDVDAAARHEAERRPGTD
jgi:putative phosphoserine phosphatase/1-acylglycerol-3-phosphate O-acyltransferase